MRWITLDVPAGRGGEVAACAQEHGARNLVVQSGEREGETRDLVTCALPNSAVGPVLQALESIPELHATLQPQGVLALTPPDAQISDHVIDLDYLSPLEIWLRGLQSIGSWSGFLGYAVAGSAIVWIGLFTNSMVLVIASMLIAPFAGPVMNLAIATATGDQRLLRQGLLRYFGALAVAIATSALMSWGFGLQAATPLMIEMTKVPAVAVLLPLIGGAAGALNLAQPERNSLVPGTAVGLLVAAALAPPAAVVGVAIALGDGMMARNGTFYLLLQLAGLNLGGALIFHLVGLKPSGTRYQRGGPRLRAVALGTALFMLFGLLVWQFRRPIELQRSTTAQYLLGDVQNAVDADERAVLVEASTRFARSRTAADDLLLAVVYVYRQPAATVAKNRLASDLEDAIQRRLLARSRVAPVIAVTVLDPPPQAWQR